MNPQDRNNHDSGNMNAQQRKSFAWAVFAGILFFVLGLMIIPPNFQEWAIRARMKSTLSDLDLVKSALLAYHVDWGEFPSPFESNQLSTLPPSLTTPSSYLKAFPSDPYYYPSRPFEFWIARATEVSGVKVLITSLGPDGWRNLPTGEEMDARASVTRDWLYQFQFHPTNGIKTGGDLIVWIDEDEEPEASGL